MFCRPFQRGLGVGLAFASLIPVSLVAEVKPGRKMEQRYHLMHWTAEDGLPQNRVAALAQTRDGYLWVGTWFGLARFDGVRFTVFNQRNTPAFTSEVITSLAEDSDGTLWIGTRDGLLALHEGKFKRYSVADGLSDRSVWRIIPFSKGGVWLHVGTEAAHWRSGRQTLAVKLPSRAANNVRALQDAGDGNLFVVTTYGVERVTSTGEVESVSLPPGSPEKWLGNAWHDERAGTWWLSQQDALREYRDGSWRTVVTRSTRSDSGHLLFAGRSGVLWAHCGNDGFWRCADGCVEQISIPDHNFPRSVDCLCEDREGHLWLGTAQGLWRLQPKFMRAYGVNEGLPHNECLSVCEAPDGAVWVETARGVARIHDDRVETFPDEPARKPEQSIWIDTERRVWLGNGFMGILTWLPGVETNAFWQDWQGGLKVDAFFRDCNGRVWVGTQRGAMWFEHGKPVGAFGAFGLPTDPVRSIYQTRDGAMWFGAWKHGVIRWKQNLPVGRTNKPPQPIPLLLGGGEDAQRASEEDSTTVTRFTAADGLTDDRVFAFHEDVNGALWIGTHDGLSRFKNGQFRNFHSEQGLFDNLINWLEEDDFGRFWFSCNRGVFQIDRAELDKVADGKKAYASAIVYGTADGMLSPETNGEHAPAGCKTRDGHIWFPTADGVVVIDPRMVRSTDVAPVVVIEEVKADGENLEIRNLQPGIRDLRLPPGRARDLQIRYTANSFLEPRRNRFQYRLVNHDTDWREETTERLAVFTNLRPGDYRFEVRAANAHGVWCEAPASFAFSLAPHFWQTWPFYALCGLAGLGLAGGFTVYRLRWQHRLLSARHEQVLADERARIARDLHDDLGTALTGVALELDVARRQSGDGVGNRFGETAGRVRALAERMREVVWAVNPRCDTVSSLASFLEQQAGALLHAGGVRGRFEFPDDIPALRLDSETRHQLALGVREALNNVVRHAQAGEVVLGVAVKDGELVVHVQDNGKGFDAAGAALEPGHGLHNLRTRLERVGGTVAIESSSGGGTRIELRVPLKRHARK